MELPWKKMILTASKTMKAGGFSSIDVEGSVEDYLSVNGIWIHARSVVGRPPAAEEHVSSLRCIRKGPVLKGVITASSVELIKEAACVARSNAFWQHLGCKIKVLDEFEATGELHRSVRSLYDMLRGILDEAKSILGAKGYKDSINCYIMVDTWTRETNMLYSLFF